MAAADLGLRPNLMLGVQAVSERAAAFKATLNAAHHGAQALKGHITNLFQACSAASLSSCGHARIHAQPHQNTLDQVGRRQLQPSLAARSSIRVMATGNTAHRSSLSDTCGAVVQLTAFL